MLIQRLALRELLRTPRTSLVLVGLVATGAFLFLIGASVLGSASGGMRQEFQDGYTGDIVIRARHEREFGLFGFSVPTISEYEQVPSLSQVPDIRKVLDEIPGVRMQAALVSGAAQLEGPLGFKAKVPVFGVSPGDYFRFFPMMQFVEGGVPTANEAWIVLPENRANEIGKAEGRPLRIGDSLQFAMASGNAFTIRAVTLRGIVRPSMKTESVSAPVYADAVTVRSLLGLSIGSGQKARQADSNGFDADSFFSSDQSGEEADQAPGGNGSSDDKRGLDLLSNYLSIPVADAERPDPEQGAWTFILVRVDPSSSPAYLRWKINTELKNSGIEAEAVDWLAVAGLYAGILSLLMTLFQVGIAILAAVVALVLANGLAFSVLEQTKEIGTMRAIGAQRGFVRSLYLYESLFLVAAGLFAGIGVAALAISAMSGSGIPISNSYLVLLFGATHLKPGFPVSALFGCAVGGTAVALVASLYPIHLAGRTSIASAMSAE